MTLRNVLHLRHIHIFRGHGLQILLPVADKVGKAEHDVIRRLTRLKRNHRF